MPDQPTRTPAAGARKGLTPMRAALGVTAMFALNLIAGAVSDYRHTRDAATEEPPDGRASTAEERAFETVVRDVAATMQGVTIVEVTGFYVELLIRSNSGRQSWPAEMGFDQETGGLLHRYHPHPGAKLPRQFAEEVERRLRDAAAARNRL